MLGASIAITIDHPPVNSFHDILKSEYKLYVTKGTSVEKLFLEANQSTTYERILKSRKLVSDVAGEQDIVRKIRNGSLNDHTLFFGVYQPIRWFTEWSCSMSSVKVDYRKVSNGLVFQKNWKFAKIVNYHLLLQKENGILNEIQSNYHKTMESICKAQDIMPARFAETMSLYVLMAIGFSASLLLFCIEHMCQRYFQR